MRVRIAVAVDGTDWSAYGDSSQSDTNMVRRASSELNMGRPTSPRIVWIEADIPPPQVVEGEVK